MWKKHEASKLVKFWRDQAERDFACEAEEYEREEKENQQKRGDFLRRRWRRRNRTERNERVYVSFWIFLWIRTCWVCIKRKWRKRRSLGSNSNTECNHARVTWTQANGLVVYVGWMKFVETEKAHQNSVIMNWFLSKAEANFLFSFLYIHIYEKCQRQIYFIFIYNWTQLIEINEIL